MAMVGMADLHLIVRQENFLKMDAAGRTLVVPLVRDLLMDRAAGKNHPITEFGQY